VALRNAGKKVVTATWPGADGLDIRLPPGSPSSPIIQSSSRRTTDYTVPFGDFGGIGAQGFSLTAADFSPAPTTTTDQLTAAGRASFSPILQKTSPLETFTVGGVTYTILVAALDTTDDHATNYETLVFFDATSGIQPGPFILPSTGPAYDQVDRTSSPFYLEGSSNRAGTAFFVSALAPDLSTVRIARYAANFIPRNAPVIADVDDVNHNVGFWLPQPDFRIPERISPGFGPFPDLELETMYRDQVRSFTNYQTRVALRAISENPDADLVMTYFEQPDGSGHQFLLIDPRQPTDFTDRASIFEGQDSAKVTRYRNYLKEAYQAANQAIQAIIDAVGTDEHGELNSNIFVVSDHGFAPFHTAVSINNLLASNESV
jgi:Type I phosphodiesterase / nucleotide pyrophosphatase